MTYRSLSRYSPGFTPDDQSKSEGRTPPPIQFRYIALLLVGGIVGGASVGLVAAFIAYAFTPSIFVTAVVPAISVYGTLILCYRSIAREQKWPGLRARFAPVGPKKLVVGVLGGLGVLSLIASTAALLHWAGVKIIELPDPTILPTRWTQLPLALLAIGIVGPVCEELLFRGLLLDWLKQKVNVWISAVILSLIFSLLHYNHFVSGAIGWLAFADRFLLGLGASALAIRYRSLRPSVVMHATLNTVACFVSIF